MKNFLFKLVILLMSLFLIIAVNYIFLRHYIITHIDNENLYSYDLSWLEKLEHNPEIIFMGSSTVRYGVNPQIISDKLGMKEGSIINIAYDAMTPLQNYHLIMDLDPNIFKDVHTVIYGIDKWIFTEEYYKHDPKLLYLWKFDQLLYMIKEKQISMKMLLGINLLKKLIGNIKDLEVENTPGNYGSVILQKKPVNFNNNTERFFNYSKFPFSKIQFEYLSRIMDFFNEKGIEVLFLLTPRSYQWRNDYTEKCSIIEADFNRLIRENHSDIQFINTYDLISEGQNDLYFNDSIHLNGSGQDHYSKIVAEILRNELIQDN